MRLLIVGGHLTPALSLLQYLKLQSDSVIFVGRPQLQSSSGSQSHEEAEVTKLGFRFIPFDAPKYNRYSVITSILGLPKLYSAYCHAVSLLKANNPDVVVGFGGNLAVPIALAAWQRKIPIVIHEQTTVSGLANQFIGRFASAIALSYPSSRRYFTRKNIVVTGNLLRQEIFQPRLSPPKFILKPLKRPLLYVTGGNQGSTAINQSIASVYSSLCQEFFVVHQTGSNQLIGSLNSCQKVAHLLPPSLQSQLILKPWFSVTETSWLLHQAYLVISRAGANTIAEIMTVGVPNILIPLPKTHLNEQTINAHLISQSGGGITLEQADLTPKRLLSSIHDLVTKYPSYLQGMRSLSPYVHPYAVRDFYALIQKTVKAHR
jgi:UDP-N-acetylglucosamine--N-acetylmuramyl-(pentapeptide) pyrophosphoryl-undecaprenol N-acetylglucosamine transferase